MFAINMCSRSLFGIHDRTTAVGVLVAALGPCPESSAAVAEHRSGSLEVSKSLDSNEARSRLDLREATVH